MDIQARTSFVDNLHTCPPLHQDAGNAGKPRDTGQGKILLCVLRMMNASNRRQCFKVSRSYCWTGSEALVSNRPSTLAYLCSSIPEAFFMGAGARQRMNYCWRIAPSEQFRSLSFRWEWNVDPFCLGFSRCCCVAPSSSVYCWKLITSMPSKAGFLCWANLADTEESHECKCDHNPPPAQIS